MIEFLTRSTHFYDFVTYGVIALGLFNLLEILFLLYSKRRVERAEARKTELKRLASTALITATSPADLLPPPTTEEEFAAYSESISSVLDSFEGEIAGKASLLLEQFGIDAFYRRLTGSRAWYKRGNAVDILSSFRLRSSRDFFLELWEKEERNEVKYRIVYGLSFLVRGRAELRRLAGMISSLPYLTSKYTQDIFYNAIVSIKTADKAGEFGSFLKEMLAEDSVSVLVKRDILTACYESACDRGRALLKEYYDSFQAEPEILVAALKALARIGDFTRVPQGMKHSDWRVRMTALKSADLCCTDMAAEMRALLRDPSYHVRMAAALALARSGEKGVSALKEESASADSFSAQAAAYALTQVPS